MLRIGADASDCSEWRNGSIIRVGFFFSLPLEMHQSRIGAVPGKNTLKDPKHPFASEASAFTLFA
jgi:hypothetical protein